MKQFIKYDDIHEAGADIGFDEEDDGLTVTIDTERLRLTSVTQKEEEPYYTYLYGDSDVMEKFGEGITRTADYVKGRVTDWVNRWKNKIPFSSFAVRKQDNDEFTGQVVLGYGDNPGETELAYLLSKKDWGKGIGSEAVKPVALLYTHELVKKGYKIRGVPLDTLTATARPDNPASVKILENTVGMELENQAEKHGAIRNHYRLKIK